MSDQTDLDNICRACLQEKPEMLDLFDPEIMKMYSSCTLLKIEEEEFAQQICFECLEQTEKFYNFRQLCLKNDLKFRQLVTSFKRQQIKQELIDLENMSFQEFDADEEDPLRDMGDVIPTVASVPVPHLKIVQIESVLHPEDPEDLENPEDAEEKNGRPKRQIKKKQFPEQQYFKCTICKKMFERHGYLMKHMRRHPELWNDRFKCLKCKTEYTNVHDLNEHLKSHQEDAVKCPKCNKKLADYSQVQGHFLSEHIREGDVLCTFCKRTIPTNEELKQHVIRHLAEPLNCDICNRSFKTRLNLKVHLKKHDEELKHSCGVCNKVFMERRNMWRHLRTHQRKNCQMCNSKFGDEASLVAHLNDHRGEFKCPRCDTCFSNSNALELHQKTHDENQTPYICKVCSKAFKKASDLLNHILTHPGQEPFRCECGMRFTKKLQLRSHKLICNNK